MIPHLAGYPPPLPHTEAAFQVYQGTAVHGGGRKVLFHWWQWFLLAENLINPTQRTVTFAPGNRLIYLHRLLIYCFRDRWRNIWHYTPVNKNEKVAWAQHYCSEILMPLNIHSGDWKLGFQIVTFHREHIQISSSVHATSRRRCL